MKVKFLAAACAALCSAGAFAAPLATNTGNPANLVTYYIAGASAQAQAVDAVLKTADFFATPTDVVKISGGSTNSAYYGMSNAAVTGGVSKPLLIIYRNSNGSGSGVRQLLAKGATMAAKLANIAAIPNTDNTNLVNLAGTCGAVAGVSGSYTASCTAGFQALAPDVALSDVTAKELAGVFPTPGANYYSLSQLVASRNALQGFGIAVNERLHRAAEPEHRRWPVARQLRRQRHGGLPAVDPQGRLCQPDFGRRQHQGCHHPVRQRLPHRRSHRLPSYRPVRHASVVEHVLPEQCLRYPRLRRRLQSARCG